MKIRISEMMSDLDAPDIFLEEKKIISSEKLKASVHQKIQNEKRDRENIRFFKFRSFRLAPGFAAAILLFVILPATVFAAVAVIRIFADVESLFPWEDSLQIEVPERNRYEQHILEHVNSTPQSVQVDYFTKSAAYIGEEEYESYTGPVLPGFDFNLLESYYDGSRLLLGYQVALVGQETDRPFGPENEEFELLRKCEEGDYYLNISDVLGEERLMELNGEYSEKGHAGRVVQILYISDHAYLKNGKSFASYMTEQTPEGTFLYFYDPAQGYEKENPPNSWLIEEAQNLDELEIGFRVRSYWLYFYVDDSGEYYYQTPTAEEMVYFTIDNVNS